MKAIYLILFFCLFWVNCFSQTFVSKHYTTNEGLPSSEVYFVLQDSKGYIWFGTNFGVSRFDGYRFTNFDNSHGLPDNTVFEIYEDYKNRIWFISYSCKLSYFENDSIHLFKYNNKLLKSFKNSTVASKQSFHVDKDDAVYLGVYTQGLFKISASGEITNEYLDYNKFPKKTYVVKRNANQTFVVTNYGIDDLNKNSQTTLAINFTIGNSSFDFKTLKHKGSHNLSFAVYNSPNQLLFSSTNNLFIFTGKNKVEEHYFEKRIISVYKDAEDYIWIGGYTNGVSAYKNGIIKKEPDFQILKDYSVSWTLRDKEGGLWFTTLENGVYYVPSDKYFTFSEENGLSDKVVNSVTFDGENIWAGTSAGLYKINKMKVEKIDKTTTNNFFIYSLFYDSLESNLWLGTSMSFLKLNKTDKHLKNVYLELSSINTILKTNKNTVWYAAPHDVILHDSTGHFTFYNKGKNSLLKIKSIAKKNDSCLYVGSMDGLWELCNGNYNYLGNKNKLLTNRINNLGKCNYNNTLFIATKGQGLILYQENNLTQIDKKNGLLSNLVTSVFIKDSIVWAATDKGLNKIVFSKHSSTDYKISSYTYKNGLISNEINSVFIYKSMVFVGTNAGLTYFDDSKITSNPIQPDVYITEFKVMDKTYPVNIATEFSYEKNYVSISFVGLNFRNLGNVNYKYKLEGASEEWIKTNYTTALFPSLSSGKYKFIIYACNESGLWNQQPAILEFIIKPPFWKTWWFSVIVLIIIVILIIAYIKQRELRLKREKLLLEHTVIERTAEVVMQKEEIEAQRDEIQEQKRIVDEINKDITDSINYAKNIQKAIIPEEAVLQKMFPDSFIFFKPRDIVSGDFYWFKERGDYIFIAAADCTGHGVPGAFMCMLGIALLNEIAGKGTITEPDLILNILRDEIIRSFKHGSQTVDRRDGMDIALLVYNKNNMSASFAGANNPIYIVSNSQSVVGSKTVNCDLPIAYLSADRQDCRLIEMKGDKMPIGYYEQMLPFNKKEFQLKKDDCIYMFSDGFADQFGGPTSNSGGKKFMYSQFKKMISKNTNLPMKEQKQIYKNTISEWMKHKNTYSGKQHDQVDDILLLGFRI